MELGRALLLCQWLKFGQNVEFAQCPYRRSIYRKAVVVFSEMADGLQRTAEGIGEDEKADQQDDNS